MPELSVDLFGNVGSSPWWDEEPISLSSLKTACAEVESYDTLKLNINSYGGVTNEGVGIYNYLRDLYTKQLVRNPNFMLITENHGAAYSAASIIFMAGQKRIMRLGSTLMIHRAWSWLSGNTNDMMREAKALEVTDSAIADVYSNVVNTKGKDKAHFLSLMSDETFFDSTSALAEGLSTETDSTKQASSNSQHGHVPFKKGEYFQFLQSQLSKPKQIEKEVEKPKPIDHTRANELRRKFLSDRAILAELQ